MKAYVLGNPHVKGDSLPLRLLPVLRQKFPHIEFIETDPTEELLPEEGSVIIDSVRGLSECRWFDSLDSFEQSVRVSVHDYDLYLHLRLLGKIGKLPSLRIFGIPAEGDVTEEKITGTFSSISSSGSA